MGLFRNAIGSLAVTGIGALIYRVLNRLEGKWIRLCRNSLGFCIHKEVIRISPFLIFSLLAGSTSLDFLFSNSLISHFLSQIFKVISFTVFFIVKATRVFY